MILVQLHVVKLLPASAKMLFEYLLAGKADRQTDRQTARHTDRQRITIKKLPSLLSCDTHAQVRMPSD